MASLGDEATYHMPPISGRSPIWRFATLLVPLRHFGQSMQPFALSFTAIPWDSKYGIRWGLAAGAIPFQLLALQARQTMMSHWLIYRPP
jgi:hypothetical protein